jgi:hypothetical protein
VKDETVSRVMQEMGRKGGKRRLETMSFEERSAIAKKAAAKSVAVRKAKAKKKPKATKVPRARKPKREE